jgi:hypothetical protein
MSTTSTYTATRSDNKLTHVNDVNILESRERKILQNLASETTSTAIMA